MTPHKKISKLPENELINACKTSNGALFFRELYSRYILLFYGVALKYLGNADKAKEAVETVFNDISQKITVENIDNFRIWLYSEIKSYCLK
ncbi:MAG: sigma-70 family RNA polymerase sigma factor, partial [Prevotellaceae bacterium]|nr:sigma-70 family RNA polymerase sigma factor [Prevotellaceae bacterium]